jgi:hypothetical protein
LSFVFSFAFIAYNERQFWISNDESVGQEERTAAVQAVACDSPIWLISSLFEFAIILIFYFFVVKIDKITKKQIEQDKEVYGYPEEYFIKIAKRMFDLWVIIKVYMFYSTFNLIFNIISFYQAENISKHNSLYP